MKSINIKGKNYIMVNERIKAFREQYKGWSLTTEIVTLTEDYCVLKAVITDENGIIKATGLAQEDRASSMINKTSFVENCETSAWGRALGNLGIGIEESIASAEEVDTAIKKQEFLNNLHSVCSECGKTISDKVASYSKAKFGKELCYDCQNNKPLQEINV